MKRLQRFISAKGLLALVSGAAISLAFAPFNLWFIGILSPTVLIGLWTNATRKQGFCYGYLYGLGMFGAGTSWLHISINLFGGVNLIGAILLTFLFVLFLALFPAVAGYLSARFYRNDLPKFSRLLLIPALWTLIEWVRSWFFTGFPWLNLGYSQTDSLLSGLAPLTGVFGISFAIMLTAGALQALRHSTTANRLTLLAIIGLIWTGSGLSAGHHWTVARSDMVSVALIQGAVPQELKWTPEMLQPTLDRYMELTRPHLGANLIIWPEAAIPAFYDQVQLYMNQLGALTREHKSHLMAGLPYRDAVGGKYLNSVVMLGQIPSFYFKRHLVPFGEYLPLDSILRPIVNYLNIPMSDFSTGDDVAPVMHTDRFSIGVSICYEDTFGDEVIEALPEAALLVNVSNDAWFGDSFAPHQHLQMARMRAIESGRYLLRATNTGVTAIIDEKGKIAASVPQFTPTALTGKALLFDGMTPYARTGNYAVLVLIALILATALRWRPAKSGLA